MGDLLNPVVDLTRLYASSKQTMVSRTTQTLVNGQNIPGQILVPDGEVWLVHWATWMVFTAAGESVANTWLSYTDPSSSTQLPISNALVLGASTQGAAMLAFQPFVAVPGSAFRMLAFGVVGAPTYSGGILISRLRQ